MPDQACMMTAIHSSGLLACQAFLIDFSSGVRLTDRQVFPAIHYEACMICMRRACHACLIVDGLSNSIFRVGMRGLPGVLRREGGLVAPWLLVLLLCSKAFAIPGNYVTNDMMSNSIFDDILQVK